MKPKSQFLIRNGSFFSFAALRCRATSMTRNPLGPDFNCGARTRNLSLSKPGSIKGLAPATVSPMKLSRPIAHIACLFALITGLHADLVYVDASTSNTTLANGSNFNPPLNGTTGVDQNWEQRTIFGSGENIFEAGGEQAAENAPELKTTLVGLTPNASYSIYVYFWDPASTSEDWNIRAGFAANPGSNTLFSAADSINELGSTASLLASTQSFSIAPTLFAEGGRVLLAAPIGTFTANINGQISVFIDDRNAGTTVNLRTWYDGLAYELVTDTPSNVTYVDATPANTSRWDSQLFSPAPDSITGADNNWETRNLGNNGNILEAGAEGSEDAPLLVTTLTGLAPNTLHVLYAYFWDAGTGNWRLKASLKSTDINENGTPANKADDFLPTFPLTHFASDNNDGGNATDAPAAVTNTFATNPLFTESDRTLMQAQLGTATSDSSGNISIYIDDLAGVDQSNRTWFDGVGYKLALPLDPAADEDGDGVTNANEVTRGTNPYLVDTDGDSYGDGIEVAAGSDPLDRFSIPPLPGNSLQMSDNGVWTWFNDERAIFHQGSMFIGYVKSNGQYGITRYNPATNESFETIISTSNSQQQDDHNNPSITVLPDGRLMLLYAKHIGGPQFYQRTSLVTLPSFIGDWGPEIIRPLAANNTYNNTYLLSGESNRIYNFHRNLNFNPTITVSNDLGSTWEPSIPFIEAGTGNVRPYPRYCSNRNNRIDLIYTDGHPRDLNNSIYHLFYQGGGFYRTDGTLIDTFNNLPLDHEGGQRGSVVYQFSNAAWGSGQGPNDWIPNARSWTWDIHYDKSGAPVCVFQVQLGTDATWSSSRIYYYYARWNGTSWQKRFIAKAGRGIYAAESDYGGGMCIDPKDPNVIYISSNAENPFDLADINSVPLNPNARFEIYRGVTNDGGLTFTWQAITSNSTNDHLRPIIPEGSPFDHTLVWFNGTYNSYTNYSCRVLAILRNDLTLKGSSISPLQNSATLTWASSPGWRYRITGSADLSAFPHPAAIGIDSQGSSTSHTFPFPTTLINAPKAFFRVETE